MGSNWQFETVLSVADPSREGDNGECLPDNISSWDSCVW